MKVEEFVGNIRGCKGSILHTGNTGWTFFPAKVNPERTRWKLSCETVQTRFKAKERKVLIVEFFEKHNLSIFEAEMMLMVFGCGMRPIDYGGFHSCIAGQEFIENIKNIKSIEIDDVEELLEQFQQLQEKKIELLGKIKDITQRKVK